MGQGEKHTSKAMLVNARKAFGSEVVLLQMRNRLPIGFLLFKNGSGLHPCFLPLRRLNYPRRPKIFVLAPVSA